MRRKWKSGLSLFLAAALTVGSVSLFGTVAEKETGMGMVRAASGDPQAAVTYYIDAAGGNDANGGTSENTAWKSFANLKDKKFMAGDKILLKAGCTWNDEKLEITGAEGAEGNPVILGRYGDGNNPVINGKGSSWLTDRSNLKKEDVAVVHVKNSKYITIENLEVTNWENDAEDLMGETSDKVKFDQSKYMLTGILVENRDAGDLPGVVIRNNYVHDVNGYMSANGKEGDKKGSGGIMALVTGGNTESYYTDLKITGNKVEKVCHEAIYMESCWAARTLVGGKDSQQAGDKKWVGWPNVSVTHNYVNDVAGDGIVLINADGGVAEYNLVTKCASEDWDYSRNPAHAAIWMWDCNNVTMQHNEAAYTASTQDGMAFDCDYGNQNVMYQYNYSHDNKGGFWMACPGPYYTVNSVVRYNVSINDGLFNGSRIIRVGEKGSIGHQVYNNTIYWDHDYKVNAVEQGSWGTPPTSGTDIYNNIFCGKTRTFVNNEGIHYDSNCVWGGGENAYPYDEDFHVVVADPGFADVENHTDGAFDAAKGKVTLGSAAGMELKENSPCIDAGTALKAVPEESLPAVESELVKTHITLENKDYNGSAVPHAGTGKVDIGAFEYQGAGTYEPEAVITDKDYLQAIYNQAKEYKEQDFTAATFKPMAEVRDSAKDVLDNSAAIQKTVDGVTVKLEETIRNMAKKDSIHEGSEEDDVLKDFVDGQDNAGFESEACSWGKWPEDVKKEISNEQSHTGEQSLKVVKGEAADSFSEIGDIPVLKNTKYVLKAWFYCPDGNDITKVGMEAKHHNKYTGGSDLKVLQPTTIDAGVLPDEKGWYQFSATFTTDQYDKLSIALCSQVNTVYMDDVVLYPESIEMGEKLDWNALEKALELEPKRAQSYYTPGSWQAFLDAKLAARLKYADALAEQSQITAAASKLQEVYNSLTKKADRRVLQLTYDSCKGKVKGSAADAVWNAFQEALRSAKTVLDNADADQKTVDAELLKLKTARDNLTPPPVEKQNQQISCTKKYTKVYGAKAFNLNAKVNAGDGVLSYSTSDRKVAVVDNNGKVTIKGPGSCVITITAAATSNYNAGTETVALTVKPKKAVVSSVKSAKGKLTVKWKKDAQATGYEIQCSLKKDFKKIAAKTTVKKSGKVSAVLNKLKKGKKYYVRVCAYKTAKVNGKTTTIRGEWSKPKVSKKVK
ncbi:MAG: hypothetical protein HFI70_09625 [Lachnospiraceae bacterium]|nr:hypothetical protein [Lachnospiraceae bacterium]